LPFGTDAFVSAFHPMAAQKQTWLKFAEGPIVLKNSKSERPQNSRDEVRVARLAIRIVLKANGKLVG
jgi:hypothetical protein